MKVIASPIVRLRYGDRYCSPHCNNCKAISCHFSCVNNRITVDLMDLSPKTDHAPEVAMSRFKVALGRALAVSKSDLDKMLDTEKQAKAAKPRRGPKPKTQQP